MLVYSAPAAEGDRRTGTVQLLYPATSVVRPRHKLVEWTGDQRASGVDQPGLQRHQHPVHPEAIVTNIGQRRSCLPAYQANEIDFIMAVEPASRPRDHPE
jgi:hypothetical protein